MSKRCTYTHRHTCKSWVMLTDHVLMSIYQFSLLNSLSVSIPIIPVPDSAAFLPSIQEYINGLADAPQLNPTPSLPTSLLAHVTTSAPYHPLSETDTNILSDLFPSLPALSRAVRTREGQALMMDHFDSETARRILGFWEEDRVCE